MRIYSQKYFKIMGCFVFIAKNGCSCFICIFCGIFCANIRSIVPFPAFTYLHIAISAPITNLVSDSRLNDFSLVRKLVKENRLPHLLLYGPPGTGKTSTILTIAKEINGPNYQQM